MDFSDFLILFSFLSEVVLLLFLELKAWGTLYTPLNFLMLPYTVVLLITILLAGNFGFVEFHYPSIAIWSVGLLLFSIPSFVLGTLLAKYSKPNKSAIETTALSKRLVIISIFVGFLLLFKFYGTLTSSVALIGTDDFAEDFSGHGIWAHIRQLSVPLLAICIYFLGKRRLWLIPVLLCLLLPNIINMVKGVIIITILSGMLLRLYAGKTRLNGKFIFITVGSGFLLFFVFYIVLPLLGKGESNITDEHIAFVFKHFGHYLTSGILGLSEDMIRNYPDASFIDIILSPFINIYNQIAGIDEILSPVNPYYHTTGQNLTNVRTFFGTLFIYTNWFQFTIYTLFVSLIFYMIKICTIKFNNIYVYGIYFYECSLLAMGWFEFYFFHLSAIEIPLMFLGLLFISRLQLCSGSISLENIRKGSNDMLIQEARKEKDI